MIAALFLAAAPSVLTTRQMERLSPARADTIARRDLLSILQPLIPPRRGMLTRLRGVSFLTRVYATAYPRLCGRGAVTLWYGASAQGGRPAARRLTPYSVTSAASYHLIGDDPGAAHGDAGAPGQAGRCAVVARDRFGWFTAPDGNAAAAGVRALAAAREALRRGLVPTCGRGACETLPSVAGALNTVESCDATDDRSCLRVSLDSMTQLTITYFGDEPTPASVRSVSVGQFVIVT